MKRLFLKYFAQTINVIAIVFALVLFWDNDQSVASGLMHSLILFALVIGAIYRQKMY